MSDIEAPDIPITISVEDTGTPLPLDEDEKLDNVELINELLASEQVVVQAYADNGTRFVDEPFDEQHGTRSGGSSLATVKITHPSGFRLTVDWVARRISFSEITDEGDEIDNAHVDFVDLV